MATVSPLTPTPTPTPIPAPYSQPGARYGVKPASQPTPITLRMAPEWRDRALANCDKANLRGTPHHHSWHERAQRETWLVPTRDRMGNDHRVWLDCQRGRLTCDCASGGYGGACCHCGAVLYWMMSYDEAYRPHTAREEVMDSRDYAQAAWAMEQPQYQ